MSFTLAVFEDKETPVSIISKKKLVKELSKDLKIACIGSGLWAVGDTIPYVRNRELAQYQKNCIIRFRIETLIKEAEDKKLDKVVAQFKQYLEEW
jgi:hypothetical protein